MTMLLYLLKINLAVVILYAFYHLLFGRDTFFRWRRVSLVAICVFSLLIPLLVLPSAWWQDGGMQSMVETYAAVVLPAITVYAHKETGMMWTDWLGCFYLAGVAVLAVRMLVQIGSVCLLVHRATVCRIGACKVRVLPGEGSPFSFFRWIFVYRSLMDDDRLDEVLQHERVHVSQGHSYDVLFTELYTILCWLNPIVWHLRREVRENLEFLADEGVLADGNARKAYQYHLLGLACHAGRRVPIVNNFNVLPLKKRIMMMNKRRTHEVAKAKYLLFVPLAGLLLVVSNVETVARGIAREVSSVAEVSPVMETVWQNPVKKPARKVQAAAKATTPTAAATAEKQDGKLYDVVEEMPQFPGGMKEMMQYLANNVRYPEEAVAKKTQGRVVVSFVVGKDGSISDVEVARSIDPLIDDEAVRVVKSMPRWTPGKQKGKPVRVKFNVPVTFRLTGGSTAASADEEKKATPLAISLPAGKSNAKPLVVVDGEEVASFDNLDPANIASVTVLKDQKSVEAYGEKGKNGVVVITTKK